MQDNFVLPRVGEFTSFHELDDNYSRYGNLFPSLNKGTNPIAKKNFFQRAFVVADPGYGKTRLLKEVVAEVADQDKIAIYVDLKKFADSKQSSLKEYLKSRSEKLKECDLRDLKFDEAVICFDALDEIRNRRFTSSLNTLKKFVSSYPDLSILISSRLHFFKNKLFKISDLDFKYWLIYAFSHSQIRKYLSSEDVSSSEINSILSLFTNNNRDLIISVPRYLKLLPEYLKQNEVSNLNRLNRTNLFEFFIFYKLDLEERRSEAKGKEIIQRVLEMLALTMEIYQTNVLSKSELTTFLDEISSGLSQFWHNIPLKVFFDNSLLKDNNDTIEFENTEFQEYLAAKHLSRLNRPLQVTFDLVIDTHAKEIKPTWFSTLEFLTELDQNFLKPLLDFGKRNKNKPVIDERYFKLLTQFNIDQLSNDKKEEVFKLVFEYYQRVMHWLDWAVGKNLSFYYTQPVYDSLKVYAKKSISDFQNKDQRYVQLANVCQIIGYLIRHQKLTKKQIDYWREKLVTYANEAGGPGVLQRHALFALEAFKDPTLITDITGPWYHEESLVRRRFIEFCIAVDPNDKTAIEYFTDAVITKVHKGLSSIGKITSADSLKYLFELFLSEDQLLEAYLVEDRSGFTTSGAKLLQNLESIWNHDLEELAKKIILKSFTGDALYRANNSNFILGLVNLINSNDKNYAYELLDEIQDSDEPNMFSYKFKKVFELLLTEDNLQSFYERLSQFKKGKQFLCRVLIGVKFSDRSNATQLYEAGRTYFTDEYNDLESKKENSSTTPRATSIYEDLKNKLKQEDDKYSSDVFSFFNSYQKDLLPLLKEKEKNRLVKLLYGSIFSKFDPGEHGIQDSNNHQTHTMHSWISIFGDSILTAKILNIDISQYREKVINYIPFAFEQSKLDAVFYHVDNITEGEAQKLIALYKDRSDDTWRYHPSTFIQTVQKFNLLNANSVLKKFVTETELSIYDRIEALKVISKITKDKEYIRSITDKFIKTEDKKLAEKANGLLISDYRDKAAIKWRIEQLKNRSFKFIRPKGAHSMGTNEIELDMRNFAGPLYSISDPAYENLFLSLLQKSFLLLEEDDEYLPYSGYLWELIYAYFENRKSEGNYQPLENLEKYLQTHQGKKGVNWFMNKLKKLKKIYLEFIGKPSNFSESIKIYNDKKNTNYLRISNDLNLLYEVTEAIENDISRYIKSEGKDLLSRDERDVQKFLKKELEISLLRRKFRSSDIKKDWKYLIYRETQDNSDKKCDFIISYGFLGPILIELKLTSNNDMSINVPTLKRKKSFDSMKHYVNSFKPKYSIFLVIDNRLDRSPKATQWPKHLSNITQAYESIDTVKVIGLSLIN